MTKFLKISPRGFANETITLRIPADKVAEAEAYFANYEDDVERGGHTAWVSAPADPMDAIDWADRAYVGL